MKRLFVLTFTLMTVWICACAQKKAIAQAQTYIKSGSNLDKAEAEMRTLLKDSANKYNMKVWVTLTEAIKKQYEQGNEKLYLKQKYDTTALFVTGRKMFLAYEGLDSVDAMPDKKGRVAPKHRRKNAEYLDGYRKNLYNGGLFFISKRKYADAFDMIDCYMDCIRQPLFSGMGYDTKTGITPQAAYLAMYCGVMLHDNAKAMKYQETALLYGHGRENALQFTASIFNEEKDTERYRLTLEQGFREYPKSEFFFTRLVDYYNSRNNTDSAMCVADTAISIDPTNTLYLYAKANILLNTGKYAECAALCDTIIAMNDSLPDVYYTAGLGHLNLAFEAEKKSGKKARQKAQTYYRKSLPYMEKYRAMAPDQKDKWAAALYNIYLNLNMGKKFEEISAILEGK